MSPAQEGILGVTLYVLLAVAAISTIFFARAHRILILVSLYSSIFVAIICSIAPNYYTLLCCRALIGLSVGLNFSSAKVCFAQNASSRKVKEMGLYMFTVVWGLGICWVEVLGWLFLNIVGWRSFILLTSLPLLLPPILILHCSPGFFEGAEENVSCEDLATETALPDTTKRILKLSAFHFISTFYWGGEIFLLPALIRLDNFNGKLPGEGSTHHSTQSLIMAGVIGSANMVGKPLGYIFRNLFPFKVLQPVLTLVAVVTYTCMLFRHDVVILFLLLGLGKLSFAMQEIELGIVTYDAEYYGSPHLALGAATAVSCSFLGGVAGTCLTVFVQPEVVIVVTLLLGFVQVFVICSIVPPQKEVKLNC